MPEPLDREAFLRTVAQSVDLQPTEVGSVVEEIGDHLSDAAAGWREAGYTPEDAERRAIRSLGDPADLGRELGQARHRRRHLLGAVGGGIFNAFAFGLWSWLSLWLVLGGLALIGAILATWVLKLANIEWGNVLSGTFGSLFSVGLTALWFAWVGWVLPARIAKAAHRSVPGVRRAVGAIGFVVGSVLLWTVPPLTLDPILAVGLPLAPFAFLLASLHPSHDTLLFPRTTRRFRAGIALAMVLSIAVVGIVTAGPPHHSGYWRADSAALGVISNDQIPMDVVGAINSISSGSDGSASVFLGDPAARAEFASQFPTLRVEIWPASLQGDTLAFGSAPIVAASAPVSRENDSTSLIAPVPTYREPVGIAMILVAVAPDGRRWMLEGPDFMDQTPPWHGTLLDWWFGPR